MKVEKQRMNSTFSRIVNIIRCRLSYLFGCLGIYHFRHMPEFLSVEPANWCMLHCPQCPVGMKEKSISDRHTMNEQTLRKLLDDCPTVHTIQFFFQGEPLLNNHLPELIRLAKQRHIYTIVSTNGLLLTPQYAHRLIQCGTDRIILSIDGYTESSYSEYRIGGSLSKALEGLRLLAEAKSRLKAKTIIEWQCLMLKSNQDEWQLLRENYRRLGADKLTLKTAQFYNFEHGNPLMPDDERFSRYKQTAKGTYKLKKPYRNHCLRLWSGAVVDAEGNVLPCCFDKMREHSFGNIHTGSLRQIWHSQKAYLFRKHIMQNRQSVSICLNCTE